MTFQQLYELALSRCGDRSYFETGTPTVASLAEVKNEVNQAYRQAANIMAMGGAFVEWADDDVVVSAGTQEIDLSSASVLTSKPRAIIFVGMYPGQDTAQEPYPAVFPWRGSRRRARVYGKRSTSITSTRRPIMYFSGRYKLGFVLTPDSDVTLNVVYAPICETMTATTDEPSQVPEEVQEYIAQQAAYNLLSGEDGPTRKIEAQLGVLRMELEALGPEINTFPPHVFGQWFARHGSVPVI
jgi:hypothetical protein